MSLGPPFDGSGERLRLGVGAAASAFLVFAIGFALLASEHTLGEAVTVHVHVSRPGALHTGALVRMAGREVGEVVAIRGRATLPTAAAPTDAVSPAAQPGDGPRPGGLPSVDIEVRLQKEVAQSVYKNSAFVSVSPTLLAEAVLEIGPPVEPVPREVALVPIEPGDHLRGVDPADIDQFMYKSYVSLDEVVRLTRDLRPDWQDASVALNQLAATLRASLDPTGVGRVQLQGGLALATGRRLLSALSAARIERLPGLAQQLRGQTEPLVRELTRLAQQLELLQTRATELATVLGPARQRELVAGIAQLRAAAALGERAAGDVEFLLGYIQSGRGTLGAFSADIQIFDELKESHRILKKEMYRLLIKRKDPGQRNVR